MFLVLSVHRFQFQRFHSLKSYYNDIEELGTSKVVLNNSCEVIFCKSEKRYEVNEMYDFFFKSFFFQKHLEKINKNNDKK